ncbi:MAG: hypothetical protein HY815_20195, partial [Candidatus Riflebacteria bacterium]|nr:hypothetical protein [Candidatus Riflebacteria bacterium]
APGERLAAVLGLRVRPIERGCYVSFWSTLPFCGQATCTEEGTGPVSVTRTEASSVTVHRIILDRLAPSVSYRLTLSSASPGLAIRVPALVFRTAAQGSRGAFLRSLGSVAGLLEQSERQKIRPLRPFGEESDVPGILVELERSTDETCWADAARALGAIGSASAVPALRRGIQLFERPAKPSEKVLELIITTLEACGGPEAGEMLVDLCTTVLASRAGKPSCFWLRARASRALGLVDPSRADRLFAAMVRQPEHRGTGLFGAAALRLPWLDGELDRPLDEPFATRAGDDPLRHAVIATAARFGGGRAQRLLEESLRRRDLPPEDRHTAIAGLAAWGDGTATTALLQELELGPSPPGGTPRSPGSTWTQMDLTRRVLAVEAASLVAVRTSDATLRTAVTRGLLAAVASPDEVLRRAALRGLASLSPSGITTQLERLHRTVASPRAEFGLALARTGSKLAGPALQALISAGKPTDLWLAALAASSLDPVDREPLVERVRVAAATLQRAEVRVLLLRSLDRLVRHRSGPDRSTWASPLGLWVKTSLSLRPGDRFQVIACGVTASRPEGAGPASSEIDGAPERLADVAGPEGFVFHPNSDARAQALVARVGRHQFSVRSGDGNVEVAQDEGVLAVKIGSSEAGSRDDLVPFDRQESVSKLKLAGLLLVEAERITPAADPGGRPRGP